MSNRQLTNQETTLTSYAERPEVDASSAAERLAPKALELQFPNPAQYATFDTILRCDAAETADARIVEPDLARDVLLDKLQHATGIRQRANRFDSRDRISEAQLLDAYCEGADAYAGLITLASSETDTQAMEAFYEWSRLAANAVIRAESLGTAPATKIFRTPASIAHDWNALSSMRETLAKRATFERAKQYWDAAQSHDETEIHEAFVGGDATRLNRAKALFSYAHELPAEETGLKVACLEESVAVIHEAVTTSERPHEDDLVGIYEYFMLESMLGRAVHDIVWLDGQDTEDNRARSLSVQYLTNTTDALSYVRSHLITAQEAPEEALREDSRVFDRRINDDKTLQDARETLDFLVAGLKELHDAEGALLDIKNDPHQDQTKQTQRIVAEKRVAYLEAKADFEELRLNIAKQQAVIRARYETLLAEHHHIIERLLAQRANAIGDILPNTYGRRVAQLVLDIDQQLNEARYFSALYEAECKEAAKQAFDLHQQLGASLMRLLAMLEGMKPEDESMNATSFRERVDS